MTSFNTAMFLVVSRFIELARAYNIIGRGPTRDIGGAVPLGHRSDAAGSFS